jgi:CopG family nickel-responsive transcriptional regulator
MNSVTRFGVSIDERLLKKFDDIIEEKGYVNRSEAIRDLIRYMLDTNEISDPDTETVGTLSLVYKHDVHEIADKLNEIQHAYFGNVVSSTHVHLDHHNCLEVLILRGKARDIKAIADKLRAIKNIQKGDLTLTAAFMEK